MPAAAQQIADTTYYPSLPNPEYAHGTGPVVFIDEGHFNYHTKEGRYLAFTRLLERDGYNVQSYDGDFDLQQLQKGEILVIANALNERNLGNWSLPTPSAYTDAEINVLQQWVQEGGSLFLIADHMPFPGASEMLAARFGFEFYNGFNVSVATPAYFQRLTGTLPDNAITNGRNQMEKVRKIPVSEGQGFPIPEDATPILVFDKRSLMLMCDTAWQFNSNTEVINIEGWSQGAYKKVGKGRVVVFGEASLFSAQVQGPEKRKMGMNREDAQDNYKLLLNIIHWLDGRLD
ncbi:MAG: DUF4350 domain-containing protein [Bacteroidota bacterium]